MEWYEDDFYNEPSEFELTIEELKENLMKSVKDDFITEMERLKKENKELQEVKMNFENIKRDYENKKQQLSFEHKELQRKVRKERLNELMGDFKIVMYKARSKRERLPKCDKCNENRRISYKTPLGRDANEPCECSEGKYVFFPQENICYEFKISRDKNKLIAWYRYEDEYESMSHSQHAEIIYNENMDYGEIDKYRTYFKAQEECQKYCDYLNNNN